MLRFGCDATIVALALFLWGAAAPAAAQFAISTFKPWNGYAMSAHPIFAGDFAGDAKSDILHVIDNADYVHVWISLGGGNFNVKKFSPWPGYAMSNGVFLIGDFDGNGKTDVVHATNADFAHVWTSNGDGTFSIKTFLPWSGYSMNSGKMMIGDFNGDGKSDVLHAVSGADYVHIWTAQAGAVPFTVQTFLPWSGYDMVGGTFMVGDIDGDGKSDLFHAVTDGANIWLSRGDGTFNVKTFLPWAGYVMDTGFWLQGDFNGDKKTDFMHVTGDPSGFNVWLSNGDGTFNVAPFSPWPGYLTPNGVWTVGDFNHDGNTDIVHLVASQGTANIWTSNGDGTFRVGTFTPWPNYAMPDGQWVVGDFDGDQKSDLLHAVNATDYAHPWLSTLPGPSQVSVEGIEVVQAIQNLALDVPIVADKQTMVRVYLSPPMTVPAVTVKGTIQVQTQGSPGTVDVDSTGILTLTTASNLGVQFKRERLDRSLNFVLKQNQTSAKDQTTPAKRSFAATKILLVRDGSPLPCTNCSNKSVSVDFQPSAPLRVKIVGLQYSVPGPTGPVNHAPAAADFNLLSSWLQRAYPVPRVISTTATVTATATWQFDCNAANAQLQAIRASETGNGSVDSRTHYIGLVSNGGGYMRGCSSGVPAQADPTVVASAPAGVPGAPGLTQPVNTTGDTDGSFADWYGGHELAHTFGRSHPGFCPGNTADDPSFPYPNGQLSDNAGTFVGLDFGDNANSIAQTVLRGQSNFDIMTYCNQPQWLSAYNYKAVRDRLTAEDPSLSGPPGGGAPSAGPPSRRAAGAARSAVPGDPGPAAKPSLPRPPGVVVAQKSPARVVIGAESAPARIAAGEKPPRAPAAAAPPPVVTALLGPPVEDPGPVRLAQNLPAVRSQVQLERGAFVVIVASLNVTRGTGKILHVKHVPQAMVPTVVPSTIASIRLLDRNGRVLGDYPQWVRNDTDVPISEDQTALINATIPETQNVGAVELVLADRVIDRIEVPGVEPRVGPLRIRVAEQSAGGGWSIAWEAAPDSRNSYEVQISTDGGRTWDSIAIGLRETTLAITPAQLFGRKLTDVRVIASDGYNESRPVTVKAP
jgi:hypothetical protein